MTTKGKIAVAITHALLGVALGFCVGGFMSEKAHADGMSINCHSTHFYGSYQSGCTISDRDGRSEQGPVLSAAEIEALDAKWLEFCQPTRTTDAEGVIRLRYAHKGCEFGRTE